MGGSVTRSRTSIKDRTPEELAALQGLLGETFASIFGGSLEQTGGGTRNPVFSFVPSGENPFTGVAGGFTGVSDPSLFAAQLSPEEEAAVARIAAEGGGTPETQAASDLRQRIISGEFLEPDARTREALQRPVLEAFEEARRGDVGAFTRAGQRIQESSPFFRARGLAERGLANALGDIEVNLREAERGRQFQAAQQAEAIDATRAATQIQRLQATALPRLVEDLGVQRGIEEFNRRMQTLLTILGLVGEVSRPVLAAAPSTQRVGGGILFG